MAKRTTSPPSRASRNERSNSFSSPCEGSVQIPRSPAAMEYTPVTFSNWKRQFRDGAAIFGGNNESKKYQRRIPELELALLKGFWGAR